MKKLLLLISLSASCISYGQQIVNGEFEQWSTSPGALFPSPTGWYATAFDKDAITKVDGITSGTYAVKLQNVDIMALDTLDATMTGPFKINAAPTKLTGYYKCNMKERDSASVTLVLGSKANGVNYEDASGVAYKAFGGVVNTFTYFEVPVQLLTNDPIDTAGIMLNSNALFGDFEIHEIIWPESFVIFDRLAVSYDPLGFTSKAGEDQPGIYPNPASGFVVINNTIGAREYAIHSLTGTALLSGMMDSGKNSVQLESLPAGSYLLVLKSDTGIQTTSLVVR